MGPRGLPLARSLAEITPATILCKMHRDPTGFSFVSILGDEKGKERRQKFRGTLRDI